MQKKRMFSLMLAAACVVSLLSGCGGKTGPETHDGDEEKSGHEPLTFMYNTSAKAIFDVVHEKYPEINLQLIPYNGGNRSWYSLNQMITGEMPDIFNTSMPWLEYSDGMAENLVDLSTYSLTDNILPTQLRDVEVDGKVYLLPCNYDLFGIVYNKTMFEEHGWDVPNSFEALKELAPQIEAAGVNLSITNDSAVGFDFQYLCNFDDMLGLSDIDGVEWQERFLNGEATAEEGFGKALDYMQEWVDLGMIVTREQAQEKYGIDGTHPFEFFAEGNTAFYIGNLERKAQNLDGTGD